MKIYDRFWCLHSPRCNLVQRINESTQVNHKVKPSQNSFKSLQTENHYIFWIIICCLVRPINLIHIAQHIDKIVDKIHTTIRVKSRFPQQKITETVDGKFFCIFKGTDNIAARFRHFLRINCPMGMDDKLTRWVQTGCQEERRPVYSMEPAKN